MLYSVEHVCVCAVYVFVVLKMFRCVGNIAGIDEMALAGPVLEDLLATFWQRFCFLKADQKRYFLL